MKKKPTIELTKVAIDEDDKVSKKSDISISMQSFASARNYYDDDNEYS